MHLIYTFFPHDLRGQHKIIPSWSYEGLKSSSPFLRVPLQTEFHKAVEVGAEGPAVGVAPRGRGGLSVGVAGHSTTGALADARVGARVRGLHVELLWGDSGGVQEAGDSAIQLLQQHLTPNTDKTES